MVGNSREIECESKKRRQKAICGRGANFSKNETDGNQNGILVIFTHYL